MPTDAANARPLDSIRRVLPTLSPRLQEAGRFLARHEFDATTQSMRGLAAAAGVNPASFTRLAQALGYAGWDELRDALVESRRPADQTPYSARLRDADPANPADLSAAMLAGDVAAVARLDPANVAAAAAALHRAPRIWIAGFRSTRAVAELLRYQLRLFRPDTVHLVGGAGPEDLDYGAFRPGDALVLTGFAPYARASVATLRAARAAGCSPVVLADSPSAPIAEGADHLLLFEAEPGPGFFPSLTGAIALAQALAAACFTLGGTAALLRLQQAEAQLAAHSQYLPATKPNRPGAAAA